jgi:hypothetical protein
MSTPQERDAFLWMQGRMVELLLRYDIPRFISTFAELSGSASLEEDAALGQLRELAVVIYLRDELFEQILPRIKRRLSFAAPRAIMVEDLPARGRIDWPRTMAASWRELPEEPPLEMHTRQRRRHFATPENLLTVVTVLEYRAVAQRLIDREHTRDPLSVVQHPLYDIVDACSRELIFPQFAGLERAAQAYLDEQAEQTIEALEQSVAEHAQPGHNGAYDDLLAWRAKLTQLRLLDRDTTTTPTAMLGADPKRDNYLYQLWLFYELADLLRAQGDEPKWNIRDMTLRYTWGLDGERQTYILRHDRAIAKEHILWPGAPGVRPDVLITHEQPRELFDDEGALIWREQGYVLDAKYYRPRDDDPKAPSGPIKRMIADLQITGERNGALLFAFHGAGPTEDNVADLGLSPDPHAAQFLQPDIRIQLWRVQPASDGNGQRLQHTLHTILDHVHDRLKGRVEVACHGVFLDTLSANAIGALADVTGLTTRTGAAFNTALDDLLVCPKPHIAPWRVDLVSVTHDCCVNGALCHIKGLAGARKPQRLTALDEIASALQQLDPAGDDEALVNAAQQQATTIARRYAQLLQPDIASYTRWIRDRLAIDDVFETTPVLSNQQRETLALARFLWEQIEHIRASNFAGPMLLFSGVLEDIARSTIYRICPNLYDSNGKRLMRSLGTLGKSKGFGGNNWRILEREIVFGGRWNERIGLHQRYTFAQWIDDINVIADIRNKAAHEAQADQRTFSVLTDLYFGNARQGFGVLNGILLAWRRSS